MKTKKDGRGERKRGRMNEETENEDNVEKGGRNKREKERKEGKTRRGQK